MTPTPSLIDHQHESRRYLYRALLVLALIIAVLLMLFMRLYFLQVERYDHYSTASRSNRLRLEVLPPQRGTITDRTGELIAVNVPSFSLSLIPEQVEDLELLLNQLGELVDISEDDRKRFNRLRKRSRRFDPVVLRGYLSEQERAILAVNSHRFVGAQITAESVRHYPHGGLFAHLLGYVGRISVKDLQQVDAEQYRGTRYYGKTGIERTYESRLHGENSFRLVERNVRGRVLRELERVVPQPGEDLQLTIDAGLQQVAVDALADRAGVVVALEPGTGAVRAMASWPAFDPNLFVRGIGHGDYQGLLDDHQRPLFNRSTRGRYPPGSTLKPFIGLAGLEHTVVDINHREHCPGWFQLEGRERKYRCWKRRGHGSVNLVDAITQSCDVFFYSLAIKLGVDRIHDYLTPFGFGQKTGLVVGNESAGLLPSSSWKRSALGKPWYEGETVITGIGQGYNEVTALQLARATAVLALRGQDVRPKLLGPAPKVTWPLVVKASDASWDLVVQAMTNVVHGPRGTARSIGRGIDYKIAGKSGTAQVYELSQDDEKPKKADETIEKLRDHALFIAFAPVENPTLAVAVIVEHGGSGSSAAAPVARKMFDYYFANP